MLKIPMSQSLAHPLYQYRKSHRLTRAQLARQLQCSTRTIARWEKGQYSPRLKQGIALSQLTGLPLERLASSPVDMV